MAPDSHRATTAAQQELAAHVQDSTEAWKDAPIDESPSNPSEDQSVPSPKSTVSKPSLSEAINSATHSLHTDLNSAIVQAIPHGLPPEAERPDLYAHGLAVFVGTVYTTFEAEWAHLRHETAASFSADDSSDETSNDNTDLEEASVHDQKNHKKKLHRYLAHILPAGIERTSRILRDLDYLGVDPGRKPPPTSVEARYEEHIRTSIRAKPHLLLAYGWCMYMAIFAGGRYVRQALSDVPKSFWEAGHSTGHSLKAASNPFFEDDDDEDLGVAQDGSPGASTDTSSQLDRPGYSFLSFDGSDDGVSLAQAFRAGFAKADKILTEKERREIIAESQTVFEYCIALVKELKAETAAVTETTYEDAERVVDQEKRALMQALEMGDEEGQTRRQQPARRSRLFLLKAVTFALLWMLFFGRIVTWLTDKTPQREQA